MSQEQDQVFFRNFSLVVGLLAVLMVVFYIAAAMSGSDDEAEMKLREAAVAEATAPAGDVVADGEEVAEESDDAGEEVAAGPVDGEAVYNGLCIACHSVDGIGAPVVGKVEQWTERIAKGNDALYKNAIEGYVGPQGYMMPARGGGSNTDEEVKAAVDYMVSKSQ